MGEKKYVTTCADINMQLSPALGSIAMIRTKVLLGSVRKPRIQ